MLKYQHVYIVSLPLFFYTSTDPRKVGPKERMASLFVAKELGAGIIWQFWNSHVSIGDIYLRQFQSFFSMYILLPSS